MDNDQDQAIACQEKLAFDTKQQAEGTALAAEWQHGASLKAYKCRHCGLWHLSSQSDTD